MESARSTGNFNRRITVADSNNIIAILDMNAANSKYQIFEKDYLVEFQAVLEDLKITVGLMGLAEAPWPEVNALMNEAEKMAEIARIRTQGQKIGLGLYIAEGNGPWRYESEVVLQNQGGSETHVPILVPFLSSNETLLMSGNFKLGVKVEPKWNQPLKANDYLVIKGTWRQVVSFSKKKDDDIDALTARIAALELALEGRLINLPANSLLGKGATAGTVEQIDRATFKAADSELIDGIDSSRIVFGDDWSKTVGASQTPNVAFTTSGFTDIYAAVGSVFPSGVTHINGFQSRHRNNTNFWGMQAGCQHNLVNEFYFRTITAGTFNPWRRTWNDGNLPISMPSLNPYASISIPGAKADYAGIHFPQGFNSPVFMVNASVNLSGMWSATGNPSGWMWYYHSGQLAVFNSTALSEGSFISLNKNLGSLPGYPNNRYPTVATDFQNLYFSVAGAYSAHININGVYTAVSDKSKKENFIESDDVQILNKVLAIPTFFYNFKNSDTRIRNFGCMAQDWYEAFELGGNKEIDEDDSPTCPSKMISTSDVAGICLSAIKGLDKKIKTLESRLS